MFIERVQEYALSIKRDIMNKDNSKSTFYIQYYDVYLLNND